MIRGFAHLYMIRLCTCADALLCRYIHRTYHDSCRGRSSAHTSHSYKVYSSRAQPIAQGAQAKSHSRSCLSRCSLSLTLVHVTCGYHSHFLSCSLTHYPSHSRSLSPPLSLLSSILVPTHLLLSLTHAHCLSHSLSLLLP